MSAPYEVVALSNGLYGFETAANVVYNVYFTDGAGYFSDYPEIAVHVLTFGFDVRYSPHLKNPVDDRVRLTITNIVTHFFARHPDKMLFFVCDLADRKHRSRMVTFERWYRTAGFRNLEKYNEVIHTEDLDVYCSILLLKTHPLIADAAAAFQQLRTDLENKPA